ncbi:hypothetical protein DUNSADRAFT_3485 [Dunaliella salina]|uniref:Uncharacterized protein n=1 Tax=Dunaliella salina TaxID=3046 RepID=A0ABQ7GTV8_DUNSA|nr:hypothetical protein DUNSADRAFT_3485 [Dunaliella salina]|eukprot:KAF5838051.1 hypothetical protein DUNSADRAFT_3485 [Dunaliella salina]
MPNNVMSPAADDVAHLAAMSQEPSRLELERWHCNLIDYLRTLPSVSPTTLSQIETFLRSHEACLPLALRAVKVWTFLARYLLHPEHAFALHQRLLQAVYAQWPSSSLGPYPVWVPSAEDIHRHNITDFLSHFQVILRGLTSRSYQCIVDKAMIVFHFYSHGKHFSVPHAGSSCINMLKEWSRKMI